jgi:diacylglycerol kinase (ATP)
MIGIFVNSKAGNGKALKVTAIITNILKEKNIEHKVFTDNWPTDTDNLINAWIVGGDGTLNYFLNKYLNIITPLAIFKGGTGNDFAWKLYGEITTEQQVELILKATPKPVDAGMCNDKLFINSVGVGFDGEVLKSMGAIRWLGGHLGYLIVVLKKICTFKEFLFKIDAKDISLHQKYFLVNIANSPRTGGGFMISPLADVADGKLNMLLCNKLSLFKRFKSLPIVEKGNHMQLPYITHQLIDEVKIETPATVFAQLDGELIEGNSFEINVLKQRFLFNY